MTWRTDPKSRYYIYGSGTKRTYDDAIEETTTQEHLSQLEQKLEEGEDEGRLEKLKELADDEKRKEAIADAIDEIYARNATEQYLDCIPSSEEIFEAKRWTRTKQPTMHGT